MITIFYLQVIFSFVLITHGLIIYGVRESMYNLKAQFKTINVPSKRNRSRIPLLRGVRGVFLQLQSKYYKECNP